MTCKDGSCRVKVMSGTKPTEVELRRAFGITIRSFLECSGQDAKVAFATAILAALKSNPYMLDQIPYDVLGIARSYAETGRFE